MNKKVIIWLYSGIILISLMVVIGGITRLTQSGLSMVEWKPIVGAIPPLNEAQWIHEFELYKKTPEYIRLNSHFTIEEYKNIFFWEYLHRLLGRIIGMVFFIPAVYFWAKGAFNSKTKINVCIILMGGIFQGFLGWFMVKSGLVNNPHVSHLRLAAHLITALSLILFIYWVIIDLKNNKKSIHQQLVSSKFLFILLLLVILQIVYGALVAGLKAGKVYNYFPKMGDYWLAPEITISIKKEGIRAFLDSQSVVQIIHRLIGIFIFILGIYVLYKLKNASKQQRRIFGAIVITITLQVVLGIFTLLYSVPIVLGVLHQTIAILVLLTTFNAYYKNSNQLS